MSKYFGREIAFKRNGSTIAGVRQKSFTINNEPADITDDNSNGWRELLAKAGQKGVDLSVSGLAIDEDFTLVDAALGDDLIEGDELEFPDGSTLSGDFFLASVQRTGEYNEAVTFEAELQSSGPVERNEP